MITHFEILIDASGSMGRDVVNSNGDSNLLPDGSSRMDLTKRILLSNIISSLSVADFINVSIFRVDLQKDGNGKFKKRDKNSYFPKRKVFDSIYKGKFEEQSLENEIKKLKDPELGGTPLLQAVSNILNKYKNFDTVNILVISDGDASDNKEYDTVLINKIKKHKVKPKIYFIGISQNKEAEKKSKRLAEFTNGKYVNIKAISYDKSLFDNFLFEIKTTIIQETITSVISNNKVEKVSKKALEIEKNMVTKMELPTENGEITADTQIQKTKDETNQKIESENQEASLQQVVSDNSKVLDLISNKLQLLTDQVNYLGRSIKTSDEDEFVDSEENEEVNRIKGHHCEQLLYNKFETLNWKNLIWLNKKKEQYKSYDFKVENKRGETIFVECKGTMNKSNEFAITKTEWIFYLTNRPKYRLYFVRSINNNPIEIYRFEDLIDAIENGELLPFSNVNRKVKAGRIWFQINNKELWNP